MTTRMGRVVLQWVVPGLGLLGCSQLLGIEGATLEEGSSAGGDTASGGSGLGGVSSGGTGTGGTGGTNVTDKAVTRAPGSCATGAIVDSAFIVGCVNRVSCDPLDVGYTISDCISYDEQARTAMDMQTLRATSCGTVETALDRAIVSEATCSGAPPWSCVQGYALSCVENTLPYLLGCSSRGAVCEDLVTSDPGNYPYAGCKLSALAVGASVIDDCSTQSGISTTRSCAGDYIYSCMEGTPRGIDCRTLGAQCLLGGADGAYCGTVTEPCFNQGVATCSSSGIDICYQNFYGDTYECSPGTSCLSSGVGVGADQCVADGCTLDDTCSEGCEGTRLRVCQGLSPLLIDCVALGFEGCTAPLNGSSAYCSGVSTQSDNGETDCQGDSECLLQAICCTAADDCGFANDGDCDCPERAWDAADCPG